MIYYNEYTNRKVVNMTKKTLKAVLKSLNKKYGDVFHLGQVQSGEEIQGEIVMEEPGYEEDEDEDSVCFVTTNFIALKLYIHQRGDYFMSAILKREYIDRYNNGPIEPEIIARRLLICSNEKELFKAIEKVIDQSDVITDAISDFDELECE